MSRCAGSSVKAGGMEIKMVLFLPRDVLSVPISRQVLDNCLETLGVTPDTRADIALALSEACANVVQHAGPGGPPTKAPPPPGGAGVWGRADSFCPARPTRRSGEAQSDLLALDDDPV